MSGKTRPRRLLAATAESLRQRKILIEIAVKVSQQGQRRGPGQKLDEILKLLLQHSLDKQLSFLKECSDGTSSSMEKFYSRTTIEQFQNPHSGLSSS